MSWRDHIKVHPACELFPPMSDEELKVLAEDIKKHGMKVPIVIQRGKTSDKPVLMDGRNRLEAIERFTDIPIKVNPLTRAIAEHHKYLRVVLKGGDPHAVVGSLNIHRRHLTTKQKRELIGKLLKSDPTKSNRQIAKMTKSSHPTVATERAKLEATGDVVKVSTSIDTKGRQQPARKAKRAAEAAAAELGDACSERSRAEQSAEARQQPNRSADHHAEPAQLPDQTANERKALYAAAEMVPTEHSPPTAPIDNDLPLLPGAAEAAVHKPEAESKGFTVTIDETWREELARVAEYLGVPEGEYANLLMEIGREAFNRKFQHGLTNHIAWWLIKMHSKYPDTFSVGSWEGSCNALKLDKLYAERNVPVGKYYEWKAAGSPSISKDDQERLQKAITAMMKRAKRQGFKVTVKRGVVTEYTLAKNGTGFAGSLETVTSTLDKIEAGFDWLEDARAIFGGTAPNKTWPTP